MRLIARKTLNFANRDDQQSFRKYLRRIYENEYNGTFYGKFKCYFFQLAAKIIKSFALSS